MIETVVGVVGSAALGGVIAAAVFVVNLGSRVTVLEAKQQMFGEWLVRVEDKLDSVIEARRR